MNLAEKYNQQIQWLLKGDPSIRYQTLRDLTDSSVATINDERLRILEYGWGKQLMELQDENGTWSGSLYSPKWTSTFYTLLLLMRFGAPADKNIKKACGILLGKGFYEKDSGINYWKSWKYGECCVTGMLLSMLCYFQFDDERVHRMASYLVAEQMTDKGWNCERPKGATHSSFHTTISALEGLWKYCKAYPQSSLSTIAEQKQKEGVEFLLEHHLYKSHRTLEIVDPKMIKLSFPSHWHFDILRCLDYFQERNVNRDKRMNDALELIEKKKTVDGFWKLECKYPGKIFFELEKVGQASRWNTLRALRVIKWWER